MTSTKPPFRTLSARDLGEVAGGMLPALGRPGQYYACGNGHRSAIPSLRGTCR